MGKPEPLGCSTRRPNLPGRLTMLSPRTLRRLSSCTLLLVYLCASGEGRPLEARGVTPGADGTGGPRVPLLEAVKTGILSSLGMDREPRPTRGATERELREMYQRYEEKLREMRMNSSQPTAETWTPTVSAVLYPATVEPVKVPLSGEHPHMQWCRAVFNKQPNVQGELTLARAELKVSRQTLNDDTSAQPGARQEVKINGVKLMNSAVSSPEDAMLDIRPEVEKWLRSDGGQPLVVEVGLVVVDGDALPSNPTISLELGLTRPRPRTRRSNKEDECDERGWCCRKSVTVSFKEIGWSDWVVAPEEYTMHFCDGTCPHNYKPASMHTQVKSRLHQITKGGVPLPCCVPAAYEPMVIMHYDSRGKLKLTPFNDLIVTKCHCA